MAKIKTVFEDCDILVVGGGMAGTGATFEARYWGRDMKIICVEKANMIEVVQWLKVYTRLIVIWVCSGMRISQRITYVMHVTT